MRIERFLPAIPFAVAMVYLYFTERIPDIGLNIPVSAKVFPRLLAIALAIGAMFWFIKANREANRPEPSQRPVAAEEGWGHLRVIVAVIALTACYYAVFQWLGYLLSTTAYLFPLMIYFNRGRWAANVLTSVLFSVGSYYLFSHILGVPLPAGVILAF